MDQRQDHQLCCLLKRELRQGKDRLEQLAYVGSRERRHDLNCSLAGECGITRIGLRPRQLGLCDEPQRRGGEGQMMLPCLILLGLEFVPADLRLGIFTGARSDVPSTTPPDQAFVRGILRGIEPGIRAVALGVASYDQPCGPRPLAYRDGPDALHGKIRGQWAAFSVTHHDLLPHSRGMAGQGAHLVRSLPAQHAQARARPSPRTSLLWHTPPRLAEIDVGVSWHLRRVPHICGVHIGWPWALTRLTIFTPNGSFVAKRRSAGIPSAVRLWAKAAPHHSSGQKSAPSTIAHNPPLAEGRQVSTRQPSPLPIRPLYGRDAPALCVPAFSSAPSSSISVLPW